MPALPVNKILAKLTAAGESNPVVLTGYVLSSTDEVTKIAQSLSNPAEWSEVETDAIIAYEPHGETALDATTFFIKPAAPITHHDAPQTSRPAVDHARFLQGRILAAFGNPTADALGGGTVGTLGPSVHVTCLTHTMTTSGGCRITPFPPSALCPATAACAPSIFCPTVQCMTTPGSGGCK